MYLCTVQTNFEALSGQYTIRKNNHKSTCKNDISMSPVNLHFSNTTRVTDIIPTGLILKNCD